MVTQKITEFLSSLIPSQSETVLLSIGGSIGALATFAFGKIDDAVLWLMTFVIIDYLTGTAASFKNGEWSSSVGFVGLFKKFFIFLVVAMCHGIDAATGFDMLRNASIFAYCLNEFGSVIENMERLSLGYLIPAVIRRGLHQLKEKEDDLFREDESEKEGTR